jgi:hypothetical protein
MKLASLARWTILLSAVPLSVQALGQISEAPGANDLLARPAAIPTGPALTAVSAFQSLMASTGTPAGEALEEGCTVQEGRTVRPKGRTLAEILDSFAGTGSPYRWEVSGGVVDLLPSKGLPDLLTARIHEFKWQAAEVASAPVFLFALPEVQQAAAKLRLTQGVSGSAPGAIAPSSAPEKKFELHLQDVTLVDALNAIVRTNKHGLWTYHEFHCRPANTFDISFSE